MNRLHMGSTPSISKECRRDYRLDDCFMALQECVLLEKVLSCLEMVKKWHERGKVNVPLADIIEIYTMYTIHCAKGLVKKILQFFYTGR